MLARLRERVRPFYLRYFYFPLFPQSRPPYFSACWRFPDASPQAASGQKVILMLPMNDWHTRTQRTQHLAAALSRRGYLVAYLNPHLGRQFPRTFRARESVRVTRLAENLFELHVHLPREPVFHLRNLTPAESEALANAVAEMLERLGRPRLVQILAFPVWMPLARDLRKRFRAPLVYDCHDYLPGFANISAEILALESETFAESDLTLCSSANLIERARQLAPDIPTLLLRNAAAMEFQRIPRAPGGIVVVGYIGALDSWFDGASIGAAAQAHPEWQVQLIGRVEDRRLRALARFPNVRFVGEVPFHELAGFLAAFTVATIPFVVNDLIAATDPIKAYEYLAAGVPVVAANLPELDRFAEWIDRYSDPADFVRCLETAIQSDSPEKVAQRRAAAAGETWDARAAALEPPLTELLARA